MANKITEQDAQRLASIQNALSPGVSAAESAISARTAIAIADLPDKDMNAARASLSDDQKKIVDTVRGIGIYADAETKVKLAAAGKNDVWFAIDNKTAGSGTYKEGARLISLVIEKDDPNLSKKVNYTAWTPSDQQSVRTEAYHELEHYAQGNRGTLDAPVDIRPIDKLLWVQATEAQASLAATHALKHELDIKHPALDTPEVVPDIDARRASFINIMRNDDFHQQYYRAALQPDARTGRKLTTQEFADAFGAMPGSDKNFLSGQYQSIDDVQAGILKPGQANRESLRIIFSDVTHPANFLTPSQLEAQDNRNSRVLRTADSQMAIVLSRDNDAGDVKSRIFEKQKMANGAPAFYLLSQDSLPLVDNKAQFNLETNGKKGKADNTVYVRMVGDRLIGALTEKSADGSHEKFISGDPAAIDLPAPSAALRDPVSGTKASDSEWVAQQRDKTGDLAGRFGMSGGAIVPSKPAIVTDASQPAASMPVLSSRNQAAPG